MNTTKILKVFTLMSTFCFFQAGSATIMPSPHLSAKIKALEVNSDYIIQKTLSGFETSHIDSDLGYSVFDVPAIHTYDAFGFGSQVDFSANIQIPVDRLRQFFNNPSENFQLSVQSLASSTVGARTHVGLSNGGIDKGQEEPLSFKTQYPYAKYALKTGWYNQTQTVNDAAIDVKDYIVFGSANVDMVIYDKDGKKNYPTLRADKSLSIHNSGPESSTLSSDVLHLYKDPQNPVRTTYNEKKPYTPDDYEKLIFGNDDINRAVFYTVNYDNDWNLNIKTKSDLDSQCQLPQEPSRTGLILLLNQADFKLWDEACDSGETLMNALKELSLIKENSELRKILGME